MSPMCMYSSVDKDGMLTPFHRSHYVSRAVGQVGLIMMEATAVQAEGRISNQDLGIWSDDHITGLKELNEELHAYGAKTAIQLAHAGRKAEIEPPIFSPSVLAFNEKYVKPVEMTVVDIEQTIEAFKDGARRAKEAGFDIIEIHGAHGYLINQFLSPLTNKREDKYGGSRENRYRCFPDVIQATKAVWDGRRFIRISAHEYDEQGNDEGDIIHYTKQMKKDGADLIDCSSGGVVPARTKTYPGYPARYSQIISNESA